MFPTPMLNLALVPRDDIETALAWAYNRWLCETILSEDKRIRSMLYLPFTTGRMPEDGGSVSPTSPASSASW